MSPTSGPIAGNTLVTLKGTGFSAAESVGVFFKNSSFPNGMGVNNIDYKSDSVITFITPAVAKGSTFSVYLELQVDAKQIPSNTQFTYSEKALGKSYSISLKNLTGLSGKHKVYVLGFSTGSKKMLTVANKVGKFTSMPASPDTGYVQSFELGTDITQIDLSNTNPIIGARIYFFVADTTETYTDNSNATLNGNLGFFYQDTGLSVSQVMNPPQSAFPQFNYIEATFEKNQELYIDVSTVDGFFFPLSIVAQDASGKELDRLGQPAGVSAEDVVNAYQPFMNSLTTGGRSTKPYKDLIYKADKDLKALLNPGLYLVNNTSELETVFNKALDSLFTQDLNMNIWQNGQAGFNAYYDVSPVSNLTFPGTTNKHQALEFTSAGKETLHVFNPVGFSVVSYADAATKTRKPIMGTVNTDKLTFTTALPQDVGLEVGMYVSSGGGSIDGITKIVSIETNKTDSTIVSVMLDSTSTNYSTPFQYEFAKAPTHYYSSPGEMVFAGSGLMNDGSNRYANVNTQIVVNGLENQISTALNRGVGVKDFTGETTSGRTTIYWATETKWYPQGTAQNYFSYFMHTATISNGTPIFTYPADSVKSARGAYMARSYGFAYDENPNPKGGINQPQVPSEFSGAFPKGTTQFKLELGPWLTKPKKK